MKSLIVIASLLALSSMAYGDDTTNPVEPFDFCAQEYAAGYSSCSTQAQNAESTIETRNVRHEEQKTDGQPAATQSK
ncbi:hypothetical protein [Acidithiobacillus caldus]|jgi:hypothetical protein|uniref:hypothetical protein n=1 Tax=Acidithiobacillus caldus TaxID=33059 RepID=UPI00057085D4|nr:hypothetical protein [Acidithiobacillus caldus]MBU2728460.1 hypothetical protein [Acidithiobacillus caldus]MBU2737009.1 hypothetical protein [Acidithiobacillus caldus ATCC 51756]MBU2743722.1 hypothetical protein [Acidithiobacillus caldus]MBU2764086.1 hypothetical protein [Acidithiobacillus caldus]MBU2771639.1 hypothetical protein [Acidithiobacillus caldus]